jgi:hypothetical protein
MADPPPQAGTGYAGCGMICIECKQPTTSTANDMCPDCFKAAQEEWQKRYQNRQDAGGLDAQKLVNLLLTQLWQHECQIITDFMPNFPQPDTQPKCIIRHCADENHQFLRYSAGPLQGYFWDVYGDDFHSPELAIFALSMAPTPRGAICVPTHRT